MHSIDVNNLPHKDPFIFIKNIFFSESEKKLVSQCDLEKIQAFSHSIPIPLLIEACLQTACLWPQKPKSVPWYMALFKRFKKNAISKAGIASLNKIEVHIPSVPALINQLNIEVILTHYLENNYRFKFSVSSPNGDCYLNGQATLFIHTK